MSEMKPVLFLERSVRSATKNSKRMRNLDRGIRAAPASSASGAPIVGAGGFRTELGKKDDLADIGRVCRHHHQAIDADADPPGGSIPTRSARR